MFASLLLHAQDVTKGFRPASRAEVMAVDNQPGAAGWMVTQSGPELHVERRTDWVARTDREYESNERRKAHILVRFAGEAGTHVYPQGGLRIQEGWLHAIDRGEYGGGIFLFKQGSSKPEKISNRCTQAIVATPRGIFAVQALEHMGVFLYSQLVRVVKSDASTWRTVFVTDLHETPGPVVVDGSRFLFANSVSVSTLETDGTQKEIYRDPTLLQVGSMVRRPNGDVWLGASHGLLRLRPESRSDYTAQWFLPIE